MEHKSRVLFIDRDGTLISEPPIDYQVDSLEKLELMPGALRAMHFIASRLPYKLVMVTNQDGLGTDSFPEHTFWPAHNKMLKTFGNEGVKWDDIIIDRTFPEENSPTRKPGTALLGKYTAGDHDLAGSYVIGDRITDAILARNLGAKAILLREPTAGLLDEIKAAGLDDTVDAVTPSWDKIVTILQGCTRKATVKRHTAETRIDIAVNLDGSGQSDISTGLGFFDHMLDQIARHSGIDLSIKTSGDLNVDEHHTIEDTGIALGQALREALGDKRGIERYGFVLPMDDCLCTAALDFGGRPWLVWDAEFHRERIGDMPTEMFLHFFKSLSDNAMINLFIRAEGTNEHHKIEGIFKAFARALRQAVKRDPLHFTLPSTKGML
ncbi:MAG TPA: bifunctional histidinol-phosphatase/imidazoleglycerol-phosphate dehydratase HisB [Muribaculum sp.]|jgi:imidazoleglycerol-phosphate dehydratase/histidinol-phosphatase|uniref:Histidine biosynthesis bifunctional protein HisB n=1 Tax=Heminiphilus faecis TaxID=2601703 RepID=A0ABV4CYE6_9BACT|nr:bifunctional histidinol-phosphatase/imidazoleglycerol-phosphate dehydratase HisB [Heminiphilus faecis]RLT77449.1 bifunctional histidinol-phosphatase/imidazoleglycerol-phosphate dehydratase HisB [bacterium J10(2018)]HRF69650.1 bifunctional histidinol-phosphatase/imidazoleglycerol-phosphate dehydratase HisB [Muribaculum sp.]